MPRDYPKPFAEGTDTGAPSGTGPVRDLIVRLGEAFASMVVRLVSEDVSWVYARPSRCERVWSLDLKKGVKFSEVM